MVLIFLVYQWFKIILLVVRVLEFSDHGFAQELLAPITLVSLWLDLVLKQYLKKVARDEYPKIRIV